MHKVRTFLGVLICFLLISSMFLMINIEKGKAAGKEIYVDDAQRYPDQADGTEYNPYKTIQDAIDAASNGDTIKVLPGVYDGRIICDKSITITNENRSSTTLKSSSTDTHMIYITASSVSIEGFTINDTQNYTHRKSVIYIGEGADDVTIVNNLINRSANGYAIYIEGASKSIIKNNTIEKGSRGIKIINSNSISIFGNKIENCTSNSGIHLSSSNGNRIENNILRNNKYGIFIETSSKSNIIINNTLYEHIKNGISITNGVSNSIENNKIYSNIYYGIELNSNGNYIANNSVYSNKMGINIGASAANCQIFNCSINTSSMYGVYAEIGSKDNLLYNNTFESNTLYHAIEKGSNQWDNGTIGNYWDDFYGPDPNNTMCILAPGSIEYSYTKGGVLDNHPIGNYNSLPIISNPSPANLATEVAKQPTLEVTVRDPEPSDYKQLMNVHFYYIGLDGSTNFIGSRSNVESGNEAKYWWSDISGTKTYSYKGLGHDFIGIWYVEVEDQYYRNSSISNPWIFSTIHTPVSNKKPSAIIDAPTSVRLGEAIEFDASNCNDTDGEIVFYRWSFGDDENVINEITPSHIYNSEGIYTASLVVIDDDGASNVTYTNIAVTKNINQAPNPEINSISSANVGQLIQFNGDQSSDPDDGDSITSYSWSFGDGTTSTDANPTHKYSSSGNYIVTLTVEDQYGGTESTTKNIEIKKSTKNDSPGFELLFLLICIGIISYIGKKSKK